MNERLFDVSHIEEDTKLFRRPGWMCGVKTKLNYFSDQTKDSHFPFSGSVEMREMWLWIDNNGIFKLNLNLNAFTLFRFLIWITPNWIPFYILSQEIIYFSNVGTAVHKLCSHHHPLSKLLHMFHMSNSSLYSLNWINKQKYVFLFELKTPTYSKWIFFLIHCLALLTVYVFSWHFIIQKGHMYFHSEKVKWPEAHDNMWEIPACRFWMTTFSILLIRQHSPWRDTLRTGLPLHPTGVWKTIFVCCWYL